MTLRAANLRAAVPWQSLSTPFAKAVLPASVTKTICKDCKQFIEAKTGHPSGQRCPVCHQKFLEHIRAERKRKKAERKARRK